MFLPRRVANRIYKRLYDINSGVGFKGKGVLSLALVLDVTLWLPKTRYSKAGYAINFIADRLVEDVILGVDERVLCLLDLESYLIAYTSFE
jgi:hypothetical protein